MGRGNLSVAFQGMCEGLTSDSDALFTTALILTVISSFREMTSNLMLFGHFRAGRMDATAGR